VNVQEGASSIFFLLLLHLLFFRIGMFFCVFFIGDRPGR
jgi:hypothetical protein